MTKEREKLINDMQKVIDVHPRESIFAALLANVAEDYFEEKIKKLTLGEIIIIKNKLEKL